MIKAFVNRVLDLKLMYVVIAWVLTFGVVNVFLSGSISKWSVIFSLVWLATQSCSATFWSFRWQQSAKAWQAIAQDTSDKLGAVIIQQRQEIEHLQEPWRN